MKHGGFFVDQKKSSFSFFSVLTVYLLVGLGACDVNFQVWAYCEGMLALPVVISFLVVSLIYGN